MRGRESFSGGRFPWSAVAWHRFGCAFLSLRSSNQLIV
jgi:hypothetical protein